MPNLALNQVQAGSLTVAKAWGSWTGTNTSGVLLNQFGAEPNTARAVNIFRTDWQGRQLLYPTARTNISVYSGAAANWQLANVSLGTAINAPDGSVGDFALVVPTTADIIHFTRTPASIPSNTRITHSFYAKQGGYSIAICEATPLGGDTEPQFDLNAGTVSGIGVNTQAAIEPVVGQPGIFKCSVTFTTNSAPGSMDPSTFINVYGNFAGDGSSGIYLWGRQTELASTSGVYIPTGASPVTLTDYTLAGTTVNLAQAPASTAVTTATFYGT